MKLNELVDFIVVYLAEYIEIFFETLRRPALRLKPIWKQPESEYGEGKFIFNPRLFSFSTLSIVLGLVIQSFIPNHRASEDYFRAVTLITLLWFVFSCAGYFILFLNQRRGNFLESVSLIFQVLSVQYVIASLAALLWGILYLGLRSFGIPETPHPLYEYLGNSPIVVYFLAQFIFLSIYLPSAVVTVWQLTRSAFLLRTFSTVMLAFIWSAFSFFALEVTVDGPIPIILTPSDTPTPTQPPTPTLPPIFEEKLNIVLAALDGPEDNYGLRNQILENLNANFSGDEDVQIITVDTVIAVDDGSDAARELGRRYRADIVIWGWYRPTTNPNITIHIENLAPDELIPLGGSTMYQPAATLADLESFKFQQMTARELSGFLSFLAGFIEFQAGHYEGAIPHFDEALKDLESAAQIFENEAEIHFYRGSARYLVGKIDQAIEDFNESIRLGAERLSVYNNRGNVYVDLEEYELALQDYNRAIELEPEDALPYNGRGNTYLGLGEYDLAVQDYDQAIALDPNYTFAYNGRGNAYRELGEAERAIQDYDRAIDLDPENAVPYNGRGNAYFDLEEYVLAIQDYNKAITLNPNYTFAYNGRGNAYRGLSDVDLALQNYNKAIELDPGFAITYRSRGFLFKELGDCNRAIPDFNQAIELDPAYIAAYNDRGSCYLDLKEYDNALENYNKAIELNPTYMLAYYNRGNVNFDLEEYDQAVQDYAQAIALDPGYENAYLNLAIAYGYLREYERGIVEVEKLIAINPQNADAYLVRGQLYQAMGRNAEAEADFERYEKLK